VGQFMDRNANQQVELMSVANVALPSSVVLSLVPSNPQSSSWAFQTATLDCPWIDDPLGNALKVVSPGIALLIRSVLIDQDVRVKVADRMAASSIT
jgi:hypothetical protein